MKNFLLLAFILLFLSCSCDDDKPFIQVGNWNCVVVTEEFLQDVMNYSDTSYLEFNLKKDANSTITSLPQGEVRLIIDWYVDGDSLKMVEERIMPTGEIYSNKFKYIIKKSELDYQEWFSSYQRKTGGSNEIFDIISTYYLTRVK